MILFSAMFSTMLRRRLTFLAAGVIVLAAIAAGVLVWSQSRPRFNVILVTLDTTRADRLGAYGYSSAATGAFDEFARRGVLFEHAYAPAPITLPSHATMLTGLYPPEHDLRINGAGRLPDDVPFLPQILKEQGYDTGAFIAAAVLGAKYGLNRGFDHYDDRPPRPSSALRHPGEPRRDGAEVVDLALEWLQQRTDQPFFCWIHLFDAHAPYDPRRDIYQDRFVDQPYDAGVAWEIQQFERVLQYLKERQLDDNTLVIVVGDHGEGLEEHQETEHGMLVYNSTLHVPFVFVGPRDCIPGTRVASAVSIVDLMPTVLDLLRLPQPAPVSGRSLLTALRGQPIEPRHCYAEAETPYIMNHWSPLRAVISDNWKYIQTTHPELYDLALDPGELTNLWETAVQDRQRMEQLLATMQESFTANSAAAANLTDKDLANLQTLGYVASGANSPANVEAQPSEKLVDVKEMLPFLAKFEQAKHIGLEGRFDEAIVLLKEIVVATNQFPAAQLLLGDCFAQTGRLDEAVTTYRSVLEGHPDFVRIHFTLGRALAGQGRFEEALKEYHAFLKTDPGAAPAHFELAQVLMSLKQFDEAAGAYRQALQIAPGFLEAHLGLGQLLAQQGRPLDAASCFEQVLKYDPANLAAHANLLIVLAQTGQAAKAVLHGEQAVRLQPDSFEMRFNLGILLLSQRRFADGILHLREAQRLNPQDPRPNQYISQAQEAMSGRSR